MLAYRLYRLDGGGRFETADWIEAASDEAATDLARSLCAERAFELWHGDRLVTRSGPLKQQGR